MAVDLKCWSGFLDVHFKRTSGKSWFVQLNKLKGINSLTISKNVCGNFPAIRFQMRTCHFSTTLLFFFLDVDVQRKVLRRTVSWETVELGHRNCNCNCRRCRCPFHSGCLPLVGGAVTTQLGVFGGVVDGIHDLRVLLWDWEAQSLLHVVPHLASGVVLIGNGQVVTGSSLHA